MTRDEHLQWAKERALQYVDAGDLTQAFASMGSDLRKHPELENHIGITLGAMQLTAGLFKTPHDMRKWIEGFR